MLNVTVSVQRSAPAAGERPRFETHPVEVGERASILDALFALQRGPAPDLAFRYSCRVGMCGSCAMVVNGRERLTCSTLVATVGSELKIEPLRNLPVVRDLAVDLKPFFGAYKRTLPHFTPRADLDPNDFYRIPHQTREWKALNHQPQCIDCGACYSACTLVTLNPRYTGPMALNRALSLVVDPRDGRREERLELVTREDGAFRCHTLGNCRDVCPRGISPTHSIERLKRLGVLQQVRRWFGKTKRDLGPRPPPAAALIAAEGGRGPGNNGCAIVMSDTLTTDILILGTGGAGLMAALHAHWRDPQQKVLLVSKGMLGKSGCTRMVQGGYNVVLNEKDSVQAHFEDTVRGGAFLNDQDLAWTLVEDAPRIVRELENKIGCLFDRAPDGRIHQKAFAGQTFDRTVHVGDLTGIEIMSRLRDQIFAHPIPCLEYTRAVELLTSPDGQRVIGAVLLDIQTGEFVTVKCKAVILATGAGPLMYQRSACAQEKSADGLAMAYRAGAHLMDMEMVQFHPTGLVVPESRLNGALLEEGLRGAGAHLFNGQGERYMARYDPEKMERSTRDRVSRAAFSEIAAGRGTKNGAVLIDVTHLGAEYVEKNFTGMRDRCLRIGFDLARERVEVAPTAHFNMGGVRIDRNGATNLEGLFAAGEDASGVHGANRLGGNGVAESTVYGARVGEYVAGWVRGRSHDEPAADQVAAAHAGANEPLEKRGRESPFAVRDALGKVMWEKVGIVRDGAKLTSALSDIAELKRRADIAGAPGGRVFNLAWQQALDVRNMLTASELIARSALAREDSRGAHFRSDFERTDNVNWLRNIYFSRNGAGPKMWTVPVKLERLQP